MLKIKDNVKWEDLEQFDNIKRHKSRYGNFYYYEDINGAITILESSRKIANYYLFKSDILFDLIQSGLVEKIKEKEEKEKCVVVNVNLKK